MGSLLLCGLCCYPSGVPAAAIPVWWDALSRFFRFCHFLVLLDLWGHRGSVLSNVALLLPCTCPRISKMRSKPDRATPINSASRRCVRNSAGVAGTAPVHVHLHLGPGDLSCDLELCGRAETVLATGGFTSGAGGVVLAFGDASCSASCDTECNGVASSARSGLDMAA